jgi:hypothetical protein
MIGGENEHVILVRLFSLKGRNNVFAIIIPRVRTLRLRTDSTEPCTIGGQVSAVLTNFL